MVGPSLGRAEVRERPWGWVGCPVPLGTGRFYGSVPLVAGWFCRAETLVGWWFSGTVPVIAGRFYGAIPLVVGRFRGAVPTRGLVRPAVPIRGLARPAVSLLFEFRVGRQGVLFLRAVARRPAVVAVAVLPPGATLGGGVAVLLRPAAATLSPGLAVQNAVQEAVVIAPVVAGAAVGRAQRTVAVPRAPPPLLWGGAAPAPAFIVVLLLATETARGAAAAVVPVIVPVPGLPSANVRAAVRAGKLLQLVQRAGASSAAQRLPLQVLGARIPPASHQSKQPRLRKSLYNT